MHFLCVIYRKLKDEEEEEEIKPVQTESIPWCDLGCGWVIGIYRQLAMAEPITGCFFFCGKISGFFAKIYHKYINDRWLLG